MSRTHIRTTAALAAVSLFLMLGIARADEPLPPPQKKEVWSANRLFCAVMDPRPNTTVVYRVGEDGTRERHWAMYGWFRVASLADDGLHLVAGYDGMNLVPVDVEMDEVMMYFFRRGELLGLVTLGELVRDRSHLQRTVSHYHWGGYQGLDDDGHYVVETVEKRTLVFDVTTGEPVAPR